MKNCSIFTKILTLSLMVVISIAAVLPFTAVRAEAAKAPDPEITVPTSMVGVSKTHATFTKISTIATVVNLGIKGIGSFTYACENSDGTVADFYKHAMTYFTGNVDENEQIADLKDSMNKQFDALAETLDSIQAELETLKSEINSVSLEIQNNDDLNALYELLDDFYKYFYEKNTLLKNAYDVVESDLNNASVTDPSTNMDVLFAKAYDLNLLSDYVTGAISFEDTSIFDSYFHYELLKNNVDSANDESYLTAVENTLAFAMKIFSAEVFQKYCLSYTLAYQLNWLNEQDNVNAIYNMSVTIPNDTAIRNRSRVEADIYNANVSLEKSMGAMAKFMAKICNLSAFVGYTEGGCEYYAPVTDGTLAVYSDAEYALSPLADEFTPLFRDGFSFKTDKPEVVEIDRTGKLTFIGTTTEPITVSYVYGEGDKETVLYSVTLNIADKLWQGGYGTVEAPYLISTDTELRDYLADSTYHSKHVKLMNDINMSLVYYISSISNLTGSIDGGGYTIIRPNQLRDSLVITNNGTIKNLNLDSPSNSRSPYGDKALGGIACTNNGLIENCNVSGGQVRCYVTNCDLNPANFKTSISSSVGGIAGVNNGTIRKCSVSTVYLRASTSTRDYFCVATSLSKGETWMYSTANVGGIAGVNNAGGVIEDCYNEDSPANSDCEATYYKKTPLFSANTYYKVSATANYGKIVGKNQGTVNNCTYYAITEQSNTVTADAFNIDGDYKSEIDSSCATYTPNTGANGTKLSAMAVPVEYISSISVLANPLRAQYDLGDAINTAGLVIVDNNGNEVVGFTTTKPDTDSYGTKYVTVNYGTLSTSVPINVQCMHYGATYSRATAPTCMADGYTEGVWCEGCDTYTTGHALMPKSNSYCADNDKNHLCDLCTRTVSGCTDTDDHLCDVCGEKISDCNDNNKNHFCDLCDVRISVCEDEDKDHYCDTCEGKISNCADGNNDHRCDVCDEKLSECFDSDNHLCDTCGNKISDHKDEDGNYYCDICTASLCTHADTDSDHLCNTCGTRLTPCTDNDDHYCDICGEKISVCSDADDHKCDVCKTVISSCDDKNRDHLCDVCRTPLSSCKDDNNDHKCDICTTSLSQCLDEDKNHLCDICGTAVSECTDADDHFCDICGTRVSTCSDSDDHKCDVCRAPLSSCADADSNHKCDICKAILSTCRDDDSDHKCDVCEVPLSVCEDKTEDHLCDICGVKISEHSSLGGHNCDLCGTPISTCKDDDRNHACDICAETVGRHECAIGSHECGWCGKTINACVNENATVDHLCDICGKKVGKCIDTNSDHDCDICGEETSTCADEDRNHACDVCAKKLTVCKDDDNNHKCDICEVTLSECADEKADHKCDRCGKTLSECTDGNEDDVCDLCGGEIEGGSVALTVILSIVGGGVFIAGVWLVVRKLMGY